MDEESKARFEQLDNLCKGLVDAVKAQSVKLDSFMNYVLGDDNPNTNSATSSVPSSSKQDYVEHNYSSVDDQGEVTEEIVATDDSADYSGALKTDDPNSINTQNLVDIQTVNVCTSDVQTDKLDTKGGKYGNMLDDHQEEIKADHPVDEQLANNVDFMVTHHLEEKALERLTEKYVKPSNIKYLVVPRINQEIWDWLPDIKQQHDAILQKNQEKFQTGLIPLIKALDHTTDKKTVDLLKDSLKLLTNYNMDMNMTRRYNCKPHMQKAKHLVKKETPITEHLFGDNLNEEFKRIDNAEKVRESMKFKPSDKKVLHHTKPYDRMQQQTHQNSRLAQIRQRARNFLVRGGHHGSNQAKKTPYHQHQQVPQQTQFHQRDFNQFYPQQQQKNPRLGKNSRGRGRGSRPFSK